MSSHTLLFHIGMPKTGTTALQHFLYENNEQLKQKGWIYPNFVKEFPQYENKNIDNKFRNGMYFYTDGEVETLSEKWKLVWASISNHLKKNNVIISAEAIGLYNSLEIFREAKKRYSSVKVIVYLRRQDLFAESAWTELVRGNMIYTYSEYQSWMEQHIKGKRFIDVFYYYSRLKSIEDIIGYENLIVRVYEKEQFQGKRKDVISDFFSVLGIDIDWEEVVEPKNINERLGMGYTEIKRIINMLKVTCADMNMNDATSALLKAASIEPKNNQMVAYFTPDERNIFLEKFQKENELVAQKYLGREDGVLFYDSKTDIPQNMMQATGLEEDIIKTFTYMFSKQNERMNQKLAYIKYQNRLLVQNMVQLYKGNRKLIYFAAGKRCEEYLKNYQLLIEFILDNNFSKVGKEINGIKIRSPKEIEEWGQYFILVTCLQTDEIEEQLRSYGLQKGENYILMKELI